MLATININNVIYQPRLIFAILFGMAVVVLLRVAVGWRRTRGSNGTRATAGPLPYARQRCLLSNAERAFYLVLLKAIPQGHLIFPKMRVADFLSVHDGAPNWYIHFNKIAQKHIDFIICDGQTFEPLLAVELDDRSHDRPDRRERDTFIDKALLAAGLPLHREPARRAYRLSDLQAAIAQILPRQRSIEGMPHLSRQCDA